MQLALLFWILMIVWLAFGFALQPTPFTWRSGAGNILLFFVIGVLGWQVFGAAIHR